MTLKENLKKDKIFLSLQHDFFFLFEFLCYITFKNFLVCTHNLQLYDCVQSQQFHSALFHAINDYILFH